MKINKLKINEKNPRIIKDRKFKKLVQSIKEFPEMLELRPIVVDENNIILGGNMRYRACIEAGLKDVPIKIAKGLTDLKKKEFIIKDNASYGEWDWDVLGNEWETYDLDDWGLDVWQPEQDIKEIVEFNESINFNIKCKDIKQFEELKEKLNTNASKLNYEEFIKKMGL